MRRLVAWILLALLLTSGGLLYGWYREKNRVPPAPPVPAVLPQQPALDKPIEVAPAVQEQEEEPEPEPPLQRTMRIELEKDELVTEREPKEHSIRLTQPKGREILPGVTIKDKEVRIDLEQEDESLNLRRDKTPTDSQLQMLWKRKF